MTRERRDARRARAVGSFVALLLAVALAGCPGRTEKAQAPPPVTLRSGTGWSVLLVTIDTLRADHVGAYGYSRPTTPHIDALAAEGTLFESAYTYWPKTRGSFVAMLTGRRASQTGYSKSHPVLLDANPTLASVLHDAGYDTVAAVDNANVAASLGYAKGFRAYTETWEDASLPTEMDRTHAITEAGARYLAGAAPARPFLLWLHYVNPHTPYTPPPPYDSMFTGPDTEAGPRVPVVYSLHTGIPHQWAVEGRNRLAWYVAQYDGEIAAVDAEVGKVMEALRASPARDTTLVVLTSDHGESLGEHDYYFDHGEDVFDPCLRIPLVVVVPGGAKGQKSGVLASTLDVVPTVLDAVKVSWPPALAGESLLPALGSAASPPRGRLFAQNDRNLTATWDHRWKLVATPKGEGASFALYDRREDPGETRDVSATRKAELKIQREALERYGAREEREWDAIRERLARTEPHEELSDVACEGLKALGYVVDGCR